MASSVEALVAAAVADRQPQLEQLVREHVDRELARLVGALVEQELAVRRNGGPPPRDPAAAASQAAEDPSASGSPAPAAEPIEQPPSPATKVCRACGAAKPIEKFPPGRNTCRTCKTRRQRERERRQREAAKAARAAAGEAPHPAPRRDASRRTTRRPTPTTPRGRSRLVSASERDQAERARTQIAAARLNGVEYVERDGRRFVVLHLPGPEPRALTARVPVKPRAALGPPRVS